MKKFFRILGIIVVLIVAVILVAGALAPNEIKVDRNIVIKGQKDVVFYQLSHLRNWENWLPWYDMDPNMKVDYAGTDGQPGSTYHWVGEKSGEGRVTIMSMAEHTMLYDMLFIDWDTKAKGYVKVEDAGEGQTRAIWGFTTHYGFPANGIMAIMNMKKMLEKDFDKGLQKLKTFVESGKAPAPQGASVSTQAIEEVNFPATTYASIRKTVSFGDMEKFFGDSYEVLGKEADTRIKGNATGIIYKWDDANGKTDIAAAFPIGDKAPVKGAQIIDVAASKAYKIVHIGDYTGSYNAHMAMGKYLAEKGKTQTLVVEEYITGPFNEKDATKWITNIYYLVP